jgi:hypothetical protein
MKGLLRALEHRQAGSGSNTDHVAGGPGGRAVRLGAFIDDGVVRLEALVEGLVDELAERPVCTWCTVEVFQTRSQGRLIWAHRRTGLLVCSGQVVGGWGALREAAPSKWRVAKRPRRADRPDENAPQWVGRGAMLSAGDVRAPKRSLRCADS